MAKQNNDCWRRIETVLKDVNMSTNYLAKHIGLLRGENLYQIKRGNNKISIDVARRINQKFPEYSIPWLMFGIDDVDGIPGVMRVPYYNTEHALHRECHPRHRCQTSAMESSIPETSD